MDYISYLLSKKYVDDVIQGAGALQGKSAYDVAVEEGFEGDKAAWLKSLQGTTPIIGENGNWFFGGVDSGIAAVPDLNEYYSLANLTPLTKEEILAICK